MLWKFFADAREKTNNGITQLELDKFLNPYGRETVKTCQQLLDVGQKDGAMKLMALWYRLLPENPSCAGILLSGPRKCCEKVF